MTAIRNLALLKVLYQHRALGYEYFEEYHAPEPQEDSLLASTLEALEKQVSVCQLCGLCKTRKNLLFGEGNANATVMFISDAPSLHDDENGMFYSGRSGEMLLKMVENVLLLKKEEVYMTTILKCRLSEAKREYAQEVAACKPYLMQQIEMIRPKVIVTFGIESFAHLTGEYDTSIERIRGCTLSFGGATLIPTLHPTFLLRNPSAKKEVYADMLKIRSLL